MPPGTEIEESKLVVSGNQSLIPSPCSSRSSPTHDCSDTVENVDMGDTSDTVEDSDAGDGDRDIELASGQTLTTSS